MVSGGIRDTRDTRQESSVLFNDRCLQGKGGATNEFPGRRAKAMYQRYYVLFTDLKKNLPAAQFGALGLTVRGHLFL